MQDGRNDLFVGSSTKFLKLPWNPAAVIRKELDGWRLPDGTVLAVNIWREWFQEHRNMELFQILDLAAKTTEWAVLVFRADDVRSSIGRGSIRMETVRDNVLFELGLLYGYLGTSRVFILEQVKAGGRSPRIADDIAGIERLRFSGKASFIEALAAVRRTIAKRSRMFVARWVPASSLAIGYCDQALRPFIHRRRDGRGVGRARRGAFRLETLIPFESFAGLEFSEVRHVFEGAGYQQVGPDDSPSGRPAMWVRKTARRALAGATYFDIPTTLFTAKRVIDNYLGASSTPDEIARLVASQARAFVQQIESQQIPEVEVRKFSNIEEIARYLRSPTAKDPGTPPKRKR